MAEDLRPAVSSLSTVARDDPDTVEDLRIDSIGTGGEGVGRDSGGRVVFVPRAAPGDLVRVRLTVSRKRWARGEIAELISAGPQRRDAPCPLYERCGGCSMQHMELEAQRESKRQIVSDTLRRIGGVSVAVPELESSGDELGYRNRITVTLRRTVDGVRAGYRSRGNPDEIVDVPDCLLAEQPVRRALRELRQGWGPDAGRLPGGEELRITIRAGDGGDIAMYVEGGDPNRAGEPTSIERAIRGLVSYVWTDSRGTRRTLAGSDRFQDSWQGTTFALGPRSFLQVNRVESEAIDRFLDECVGPRSGVEIADLYSGIGARALRWANDGARVTAVESDLEACATAEQAAAEAGLDVRVVAAPVETAGNSYAGADITVVNPPRAGLSASVAGTLVEAGPRDGMAYVSCDPATLARDLARLSSVWKPTTVRAFDAFPQTAHVETVVWLERNAGKSTAETENQ